MAYVYINPYKSSFLAAKRELEQKRAELVATQNRISQLEEIVRNLEPLAQESGVPPTAALPELCRQILKSQPGCGFTAADVMQHLANMGVDISGYSNPLAVLHTTLGRICRPGSAFVKGVSADGRQPIYCWMGNVA